MTGGYDSLIFDLDGTLWDATPVVAKGWTAVLREAGEARLISDSDIRAVTGKPSKECVKILFPELSGEALEKRAQDLDQSEQKEFQKSGGRLYPDVEEGLRKLSARYKLYLVSNCQDWYLESFFQHSRLQHLFLDSLCFGHNQQQKWDNIRQIQEKNQMQKSLYIGDTYSDQKACEKAGVDFYFASYGFAFYGAAKVENYVGSAKNFADLTQALMELS